MNPQHEQSEACIATRFRARTEVNKRVCAGLRKLSRWRCCCALAGWQRSGFFPLFSQQEVGGHQPDEHSSDSAWSLTAVPPLCGASSFPGPRGFIPAFRWPFIRHWGSFSALPAGSFSPRRRTPTSQHCHAGRVPD